MTAHGGPTKSEWRRRLVAARAAIPAAERARRADALIGGALALATEHGGPVCAYLPVGTEPGSPEIVAALHDAGHEVLLPIVVGRHAPLDWARYDGPGSLADGPIGLREPAGPRLGPGAPATARLVLVPALGADRRGVRLGRGAGHYDRSLPQVTPGTPIVVVLYDDELVDELPAETHDVRVTAVLRPDAGWEVLGKNG